MSWLLRQAYERDRSRAANRCGREGERQRADRAKDAGQHYLVDSWFRSGVEGDTRAFIRFLGSSRVVKGRLVGLRLQVYDGYVEDVVRAGLDLGVGTVVASIKALPA